MLGFGKSKKAKKDIPAPTSLEEVTMGSEGYQATTRTLAVSEQRNMRTVRLLSVVVFSSLALNFVLGATIAAMMPLKEVRPYLLTTAEEGSTLVDVKPLTKEVAGTDYLVEKLVRDYVKKRTEIVNSKTVMAMRWGPGGFIEAHSDPAEYKRWRVTVNEAIKTIFDQGGSTKTNIRSVQKYQGAFLVTYTMTTLDHTQRPLSERDFSAIVDVEFREQKNLSLEERFVNPLGFTVVSTTITEKN